MIEIYAAILGATLGIAGMNISGFTKRTSESREAVIRLTAQDMKAEKVQATADRREIYERLNDHSNRIIVLESSKARID